MRGERFQLMSTDNRLCVDQNQTRSRKQSTESMYTLVMRWSTGGSLITSELIAAEGFTSVSAIFVELGCRDMVRLR